MIPSQLNIGGEPRRNKAFRLTSAGIEPMDPNEKPPQAGPSTPANQTLELNTSTQTAPPGLALGKGVVQVPQLANQGRGGFVNTPQVQPTTQPTTTQDEEPTPPWLRALATLGGAMEGFSAGWQGRVPTAVIMANQRRQAQQAQQTFALNQRKIDLSEREISQKQDQLKQEARMNVLEAWRKGANELGPQERAGYFKALEPELQKYAPELLGYHHGVKDSEAGVKNAAAAIVQHPMIESDIQGINAQYDRELATAPGSKRAAIESKRDAAIQSYLNSNQTQDKRHEFDASAAAQYLATMPKDSRAQLKGVNYLDLVNELPNVRDAQGKPMPQFLQDAIKSGRPEIQRLLAAQGVITPMLAEEQAKEARKPQDMGDDREAISHSLYGSKYGRNVRYTDLTETEQKRVEQQLLINKRSIAEAGASVTADNRRLDETAQGVLSGLDLLEDIVDQINPNSKSSQFTKDEIARYVGPIENRARAAGQIMLKDPRFAKFQSILNQRMRAQFEIGGKALTEGERKALDDALPTGKEPSLADYQEKIDATKRVVDRLRTSRLKYGTSTVGELAKEKQYVEIRTTKSGKKLGKRSDGTIEEITK